MHKNPAFVSIPIYYFPTISDVYNDSRTLFSWHFPYFQHTSSFIQGPWLFQAESETLNQLAVHSVAITNTYSPLCSLAFGLVDLTYCLPFSGTFTRTQIQLNWLMFISLFVSRSLSLFLSFITLGIIDYNLLTYESTFTRISSASKSINITSIEILSTRTNKSKRHKRFGGISTEIPGFKSRWMIP